MNIITGTLGDDDPAGGDQVDFIIGRAGNDVLEGVGGNDIARGAEGHDRLECSAGVHALEGGAGSDRLFGGVGIDLASYAGRMTGVSVTPGTAGRPRAFQARHGGVHPPCPNS